jgi:hypothetical protein
MLTLWGKGGCGGSPNAEAGKGVSTHPPLSMPERRDGRGKVWLSGQHDTQHGYKKKGREVSEGGHAGWRGKDGG